jgi:hypothetical protein
MHFQKNVVEVKCSIVWGTLITLHAKLCIRLNIIKGILVSMFVKKSHGGICGCIYPYCVATLHPYLIADSM